MEEKDGILYCPGAGDDTAAAAMILAVISKYLITRNIQPKEGFLMVCNTYEEKGPGGNYPGYEDLPRQSQAGLYAGRAV